jgi:two-component system sensor histidine kinase MprB
VATTIAASFAALVSCVASYLSTRDAVQRSADASLYASARNDGQAGEGQAVPGVSFQLVFANGESYPLSVLPVDKTVLAVANMKSKEVLRTVTLGSNDYRELIVPVKAGTYLHCGDDYCRLPTDAAQIFSVNITGQQHQLSVLATRLWLLALGGILLALTLGYLAAQAALRPLEAVTNDIEVVAETSDISRRLDEGHRDELGRLRRVFNRLLQSVDQSQHLQRQLVLDASHELRTPLTSLRTNAQVLSRVESLSNEEVRQITTDMVTQVDELTSLIADLAELARGATQEPTEQLRLDELVEECVETARTHARTRNVTIDVDFAATIVRAQRARLARAVNNLLNNAIKFANVDGHVKVTVIGGMITVADDGPGVDPDDAAFVFDRFWRSARARALPGSGLGLAIVRQVIDELGGTIEVGRSRELGGALFTVTLPTVEDA